MPLRPARQPARQPAKHVAQHLAQNKKRKPGKRDLLSRLLLILGCLLIAAALIIAGFLAWQYIDAQNKYREIATVAGLEINFAEVVNDETDLESLYFDWDALRARNPDIVGWIIIPGTKINYPIVQGQDNSYYLYHLFDESSSGSGTVFSDFQGSKTLDAQNNLIYGHNMLDGSMFSDLYKYTSQDYFNEHTVVYLGTPAKNYQLQALATIKVDENAPLRVFDFATPEDFQAFFIQTLTNPFAAASDLEAAKQSPQGLYSLVTCDSNNNSQRVVLCCVPVRSVVQE